MPRWLSIILGRPGRVYHILMNVLAPLLQIGVLIWLIAVYPAMPDQIPTNYGVGGEISAWGSKGTLWLMPIIGILDDIIMWGIQFIPRQNWNTGVRLTAQNAVYVYAYAHDMIAELRFAMSALFGGLSVVMILQPQRYPGWVIVVAMVLVFLPVLRYLIRVARLKRQLP